MKTVETTRMELFETWFKVCQQARLNRGFDEYTNWEVTLMTMAFNAALDAVEITFPPQDISHYGGPDSEYGPSYEQVEGAGYNHGLSDCKLAIDNLNLGIKIK